jgi:hypothetical protein
MSCDVTGCTCNPFHLFRYALLHWLAFASHYPFGALSSSALLSLSTLLCLIFDNFDFFNALLSRFVLFCLSFEKFLIFSEISSY